VHQRFATVTGVALATALLGACGSSPDVSSTAVKSITPAPATSAAAPKETVPSVPWLDYAPGVKVNIDALRRAKKCSALQAQFDTAEANNEATAARVGHNNADLMNYIEAAIRAADCY
jgi:hypothetical protein